MPTPDNNRHPQDDPPQAPPQLVGALKQVANKHIFIPRTIDEAVLRAARKHLSPSGIAGLKWPRLVPWLASGVAIILLLATVVEIIKMNVPIPNRAQTFAREDLNHDGRVDILDAFALARQLKSGRVPNSSIDLNGDGVIDGRDAAMIAAHAVMLDKSGRL